MFFTLVDELGDQSRAAGGYTLVLGITTREACGNSVRNVTACPLAGVCNTESFDVTPYAKATAFYLLGHRDTQDFGRKFKIAFSGCRDEACALVSMHDLGGVAKIENGKRGFELYVGGGLGAVPHQAKLLMEIEGGLRHDVAHPLFLSLMHCSRASSHATGEGSTRAAGLADDARLVYIGSKLRS